MKPKNELEVLKKINRVEAPPFLFTRIEAKIEAVEAQTVSINWVVGASLAFSLLLAVNILLIQNKFSGSSEQTQFQTYIEDMNLDATNESYYE